MKLRFSRRAEQDLVEIGAYTLAQWGSRQAARYIDELAARCELLVQNPFLGRACDNVRPGLRRTECGRHVVFYRPDGRGVLISRILHQRTLPEHHDVSAEDDDA